MPEDPDARSTHRKGQGMRDTQLAAEVSPGLEDDDNVVGDGSISTVSYCRILRDFVLNLISRLHCRPNPAGAP